MEGVYGDKYSFVGEWYDSNASLARRFLVFYFPFDDSIEMFELKTRKTFVRRNKVQGVKLDQFYIGCSVNILGRIVKILDFACEDTRRKLAKSMEVTFCMIKPVSTADAGEIVSELYERGYKITRMKKARVTSEDINNILKEERTQASFPFTVEYLTGQYVTGVEVVGTDAISGLRVALGDDDPAKAAPGTIRARFGTDQVRNCAYASLTRERAMEDLEYFFPPPLFKSVRLRLTPSLSNCTLCIVKPHAVREKRLGLIMRAIDEANFNITALNMYNMEIVNAAEFYEVYKGIVTEYKAMVDELSSGPCVAMEIVSKKSDIYTAVEFRKLVGPADPEIAKLLRPHTLRAKFGKTKVQNAVHCSDLAEDGLLEVEYFFKILDL